MSFSSAVLNPPPRICPGVGTTPSLRNSATWAETLGEIIPASALPPAPNTAPPAAPVATCLPFSSQKLPCVTGCNAPDNAPVPAPMAAAPVSDAPTGVAIVMGSEPTTLPPMRPKSKSSCPPRTSCLYFASSWARNWLNDLARSSMPGTPSLAAPLAMIWPSALGTSAMPCATPLTPRSSAPGRIENRSDFGDSAAGAPLGNSSADKSRPAGGALSPNNSADKSRPAATLNFLAYSTVSFGIGLPFAPYPVLT